MEQGKRNKLLGARGEDAAVAFLVRQGFEILERNWRCKMGEADIIADDNGCLVFVEVKTRSDIDAGYGSESITAKKRDKYEKISLCYLKYHNLRDCLVRFDVVDVVQLDENRCALKHFVNAFGVA